MEDAGYAKWFAFMNGFIHSCMYTFKALGYRPPKWIAMMITLTQLSQMFVVLWVVFYPQTITAYYYVYTVKDALNATLHR